MFQPAMSYPDRTYNGIGRVEEGLAVFSRYPIVAHHYLWLPRDRANSADEHQRICLHTELALPGRAGHLHLFVTHWSLVERSRRRAARLIRRWMATFDGPRLLVGDLNAEPHERSIQCVDAWCSMAAGWGRRGNTTA